MSCTAAAERQMVAGVAGTRPVLGYLGLVLRRHQSLLWMVLGQGWAVGQELLRLSCWWGVRSLRTGPAGCAGSVL